VTAAAVVAPPPGWRWAYRLLGLRVPEEHRAWVARDIASNGRMRRLGACRIVVPLGYFVGVVAALDPGALLSVAGPALFGVLFSQLNPKENRRRVLRFQHVDDRGSPVPAQGFSRLSNGGVLALQAGVACLWLAVVLLLRDT
jgi:hypothetical protein